MFTNVTSLGTCTTGAGNSGTTTGSVTVANPGTGGMVFTALAVRGDSGAVSAGSGRTDVWNKNTGTNSYNAHGMGSTWGQVTSVSYSWANSVSWAMGAVPLVAYTVPTAVTVRSFTVSPTDGGNVVQLKTGHEVNSLGFNLYREQDGARVKLNASLLAGTALLAGPKTAFTAGHIHSWFDTPPGDPSRALYYVEEVDLNGDHTWYGPAIRGPAAGDGKQHPRTQAMALSAVGQVTARDAAANAAVQGAPARAGAPARTVRTLKQQFDLAAGPAVKIGVQSEGWYVVTQAALVAAGFDPRADADTLQVFVEGEEQAILVNGQVGSRLSLGGNIQFYAMGLDTTWSNTRVYWLTWGSGRGSRVGPGKFLKKAPSGPSSFPFTVEWRPRTVYFAALLNGDEDNYFGPVLTDGAPVEAPLTIGNLDAAAAGVSTLLVTVQGASAVPHDVGVQINGYPVGSVTFSGQERGSATLPVSTAYLVNGPNTLTLTVQGGPDDISAVDSVQLTYPHTYTADGDYLRFTVPAGTQATIGGFSTPAVGVLDITDPSAVTAVPVAKSRLPDGSYAVTVAPSGTGTLTLLALTGAQMSWPASLVANHPSSWNTAQRGADTVLVTHASFAAGLGPLVTLRQGQGRQVAVIDVEDLYDEFSFGEKTPYAVKDFLLRANVKWRRPPHFVTLVGDATSDPKDYLGTGDFDFVPTYLAETSLLETASDDWFGDFTGSGIPQVFIGRLPVRTLEAAGALATKIVGYENSSHDSWNDHVLLVADQNDSENDFEGHTLALKGLLPGSLTVSEIFRGSDPLAHDNLMSALNEGVALVNYEGHGAAGLWAGGLFDTDDADALTNGSRVPFVVSMTCMNGYFQDLWVDSLAEALINAPGGGALAVWASSGLTESGPQATMNQALFQALYGTPSLTLGEAVATAKAAVGNLDVRKTWILFGDPATKIKR